RGPRHRQGRHHHLTRRATAARMRQGVCYYALTPAGQGKVVSVSTLEQVRAAGRAAAYSYKPRGGVHLTAVASRSSPAEGVCWSGRPEVAAERFADQLRSGGSLGFGAVE